MKTASTSSTHCIPRYRVVPDDSRSAGWTAFITHRRISYGNLPTPQTIKREVTVVAIAVAGTDIPLVSVSNKNGSVSNREELEALLYHSLPTIGVGHLNNCQHPSWDSRTESLQRSCLTTVNADAQMAQCNQCKLTRKSKETYIMNTPHQESRSLAVCTLHLSSSLPIQCVTPLI